MPWPFRRRRREETQEAPAQRNTLTALNYAPIYRARGGNMFDDFLKSRDEEGITDEIQELRPDLSGAGNRVINPHIAPAVSNGLARRKVEEAVGRWGSSRNWVKSWSKEPVEKKPVFETHSYFGKEVGAMHSFIGLRFTAVNDEAQTEIYNEDSEIARLGVERKRIVVGYGAGSTAMGKNSGGEGGDGRLMNDSEHMVTASTETPIDSERARILLSAIPKFHGRFNYNLVSANCNDFAMTMSKLVGARVPADLYDHMLGPVQAAGAIKRSAGQNHDGGTEIIKRKDIGAQFERESYPKISSDMVPTVRLFEREIQEAIGQDGGNRRLPGISAAVDRVVTKLEAANGISAMREGILNNERRLDASTHETLKFELLEDLQRQITDVIENAKRVVTASENTKHPHVNKIIWKLIITLEEYYRVLESDLIYARMTKNSRRINEERINQRGRNRNVANTRPVAPSNDATHE